MEYLEGQRDYHERVLNDVKGFYENENEVKYIIKERVREMEDHIHETLLTLAQLKQKMESKL